MLRMRLFAALFSVSTLLFTSACPDWSAFGGDGPNGDDDDDDGNEGEGEANEGEGEANEGEGEGNEGEGEGGPSGPLWDVVDSDVSAQAELAFASASRLSSWEGRLFAVGTEHIYELVDGALETVAVLEVPCTNVVLTGPVVVHGTDLLVGTQSGAVRFHDDGSCEPEYAVSTTGGLSTVAPLGNGALIYDGQTLTLVDADGATVDTHAFEDFTEGDFYADPENADALLLVRRYSTSPGQVVRVTQQASELIIAPVADLAMVIAGDAGLPVTLTTTNRFDARFLDVTIDAAGPAPVAAELRIAEQDSLRAFAADPSGEVAGVGTSALVAVANVADANLEVTSITGERFGGLDRLVVSPSGEVWAVGSQTLLYWTASSAAANGSPTIIDVDQVVSSFGPLKAIDGALFFSGESRQLQRADVDVGSGRLEIVEIVDSVSFAPITVDFNSRFAFVAADADAPNRLVEATSSFIRVFELTDDLTAVTATLSVNVSGTFFTTPGAIAILDDATKAAYLVQSSLFVCSIELAPGVAPVATCDSGRGAGVFGSSGKITIVDPSAGVDDETYVVATSSGVGIVEPGEQGRAVGINTDGGAPALLVEGCILGFDGQEWSALNPDQPEAPAGRRGFPSSDAVVLGDSVLVVGPSDGRAGQLAHFPAPTTSTCRDGDGTPVLQGTALMGGDVRTQTDLVAAAFLDGELYVLDEDGLVWHVPTP